MAYFRQLGRAARSFGRALLAQAPSTAFEGASARKRLAAWQETDAAIASMLAAEGDQLVRRCRGLVRKNHWARCAEDSFVANAIGVGIKPQSLHPQEELRKKVNLLWRDSCDETDSAGVTDFYGQQATAAREVFQAGEVLGRFRPRRPSDGLLVPLQLQIIPAEHLPFMDTRPAPGQAAGGLNVIRSGIEFDALGARAAYWLYREHPQLGVFALSTQANEQVRVPADSVAHIFQVLRAGQYRGQPWLTPVMVTLYELDQFVDAVLVRQKLANMFLGWQRRANLDDIGPLANAIAPGEGTGADVGFGELTGGTVIDLDPGDTLEFNEPPDPSGFAEFLKPMLHAVAAGVGVTYEQLTGDLEGVNYSSIRAGLLEFRRRIEQFQFQTFAHQFCRPFWRRWIDAAVLAGALPMPSGAQAWRDLYSVEWRTPKWEWVDPLKDVLATKEEVRCGFTSRTAVIHERGYDPEQVEAEITADNARADNAGNVYDSDPRKTANNGAAAAQAADPATRETITVPAKQPPAADQGVVQ